MPNLSDQSIQQEIYILIAHYLKNGPLSQVGDILIKKIDELNIIPNRIDWTGAQHPKQYNELSHDLSLLPPDFILQSFNQLRLLLDKNLNNNLAKTNTLFGTGLYSLIQDVDLTIKKQQNVNVEVLPKDFYLKYRTNNRANFTYSSRFKNVGSNLVINLMKNQMIGSIDPLLLRQPEMLQSMTKHKRILGHLSAVYCVCFDRTGRYILTGADDNLIKIWCASDSRLLATLRGHEKEISDIDINYENTLVASGSCDKSIRVWNLRSTECTTVLQGHTSMVTSIEFSPMCRETSRWMASSGNDGIICFWSWDSKTLVFNPKPRKFIEKSKPGSQILCISFSAGGSFLAAGSNDHAIRVYFFDNNDPIKVWDQESHSALVDSIQFANNSARFLSGSKDGTAKIWKYESQKWKPLLIDVSKTLKKEEMDDTISLMDINKKHSVSMVTWNTDDTMVVTAQNNYLIKVWNSNDAKLIHELKGHTDEVFVLEANPRDPRLLLSAGHDGNVIIWNLFTGKQIKKFYNKIENEGHGCLFDTKWSPTSDMLASTDSHGYLSIFGFGSSEKYKRIPGELFFHTDYRPLMRDSNEFVVDEQTQQPPHLMQPPFLVNADGNPYDHEQQRLVPGRENLTDAQLNPLVIMNERGIPEIIGGNGDMEVDEPNATNQIRPRGTSYVKDLIRSLNPIELKTNEEKRISMLEVEEDYFIYEYRKYLEMSKTQSNQFDFKSKTSNFTRRGRKSSSNKNKPLYDTDNEENENISPRKLNHSEYDDETVDDQIIDIDEDSNTQHSIGAGAASSSNHATTSRSNYLQRRHNNDIDLPSASSDNSDYSDWAEQDGRKTAVASASKQPRTRSKQTAKRPTTITTKKTLRILEDDDNAVDIDENTNNSFDSTPKTRKTNNSTRKKRILSDDDNDSNTQISVGASNHATTSNHVTEAATTSTRKSYNNDYQSDSSNHSDYSDWADGRTKTSKHSTRKSKQTTKSTKSKKSLKILDEEENNNIYIDENTNHSFDSTPKTKKVTNKKNKKMITSDDDNDSTTQHSLNNNKSTNSNNNSKYYVDDLDLDDEIENDESSEYSDWAEEDGRKTLKPPPRSRKQQNKTSRSAVNSKRSLRSLDDEEINLNHIDIENENTNDSTSKTRKTKRMKKNQSEDEDEFNNSDDNEEDEDEYEEVDDDEYSSGHDEPCTSNSAYGRNANRMMSKTKKRKLKNKTKNNKSSNRNNSIHNFSNRFSKVNDTSTASSLNNKSVSFTGNKKRGKPPTKQQSNLISIVNNECPVEYRPPEWLTSTRPKKSPYVPQMGDEIVYFRQGHELYANAVKMYKEYDLDEQSLPWHTHKLNVQEYCKVIGMKVEIRPPRLVCLKLRVIDPVSDKVTNTKFSIKFHDMAHVVDFVILRQIYDKAIEKDWRAKDKFRCIIDDVWWIGVIEAKKPFQDEYPDSNFQCLQITWDNGESEQLSPWDLEPLCGTNARKAKTASASSACTSTSLNNANSVEGLPVTAEELKSMLYSDEEEWPGDGRDSECERILKGLQKIMELSIAEHFNYPVDLDAFPNYAMIIEYPIDLNTIRERLENRYYRRINSIQWDVRKIESNANRFNEPRSDIVRKAALLCELLLEFIGDPHCSNPIPIYKRLCQNKNLPIGEEANSTTTVINTPDSQYFNLRRNARSSHKTYVDENEDDEANDEYNDNDEYKSYNNKNSKKLNKKTSQNNNNSKHDTKLNNNNKMPKKIPWLENCIKLIDDMIARDDAAPFISPVDLAQYPDYLSVVDTCIDLKTIKKRLNQNTYGENLNKFDADCKLLFQNSKSYNTNKRSKIYMMTLRLQSFYDGRIALIHKENESAIEQEAQYEKMTRKKHIERSRRLTNTRSNHELSAAASTSSFNSHKISKIKLQNLNNSDLYDDQLNATNHFNGISTRSSSNKKTKSSTVDNFQTLIKNEHHQNSNHSQIESQNTSTASTSGATSSKYSQSNEMDNNNRSSSFMVDENNLENDSRITRERSLRERPRDRSRSQESILRNIVSNRLTMSKRSTVTAKS